MKTHLPHQLQALLCIAVIIITGALPTQAATNIISDDFSVNTLAPSFRLYENTINDGWREAPRYSTHPEVEWEISGGILWNDSTVAATGFPNSKAAEAPVYNFFSGAGTTESHLRLSFDYSVGAGDTLYAHLWGLTGTSDEDGEFIGNIEAGANGNTNFGSTSTDLTTYNLTDGASAGFGGTGTAISGALTGSGTYTTAIDIASLGIGGVTTAGDLDYYIIQFAQNENGLAGVTSIDNFSLTAIPEPSSTALLGLGGLALMLRRRR